MASPEPEIIHRIVALEERLRQTESWARKVNKRLKALEALQTPAQPVPPLRGYPPAGQELLEGEDDEEPAPARPAPAPEQGELADAAFISTYGPLDAWRAQAERNQEPDEEDAA